MYRRPRCCDLLDIGLHRPIRSMNKPIWRTYWSFSSVNRAPLFWLWVSVNCQPDYKWRWSYYSGCNYLILFQNCTLESQYPRWSSDRSKENALELLHQLLLIRFLFWSSLLLGSISFFGLESKELTFFPTCSNGFLLGYFHSVGMLSTFFAPLLSKTVHYSSESRFPPESDSLDSLISSSSSTMDTWLNGALTVSSRRDMLPLLIRSWISPFKTK